MNIAFIYMNSENNVGRGAGYVAGSIISSGHNIDFFESRSNKDDRITNKIIDNNYDILMISSMSLLFPSALKIIRSVKSKKEIPVLVGGIHATTLKKKILQENPLIDYLCIGEGESMVVEFLDKFGKDDFYSIQNLAYRLNDQVIENPVREPEDLSKIPTFPWKLFNSKTVVKKSGMLYVSATRGCPFRCTYCCNNVYLDLYKKNYIRHRPVNKVIDELLYLKKKYNPRIFYFGDEMIFSDEKYVKELFKEIHKIVKLPYGSMGRVENINNEITDMLKNTGCKYLAMGVECGDEKFRKEFLNRHMSNEKIKEAFSLCRKKDIFTTAFNIIGYPVDYDDELTKKTVEFNKEIKPNFSQVTIFYPFEGTKLYDYCIENNLIDPAKHVTRYYSDSILKGKNLISKLEEVNKVLNSNNKKFKI